MTALSSIISAGGGGGGGSFPTFFLSSSQTWVPPMDGNICIHVIGAGGSGGTHSYRNKPSGGGAGGYARKNSTAVTTSDSIVCVVGAGGSHVWGNSPGVAGGYSRATFSNGPQVTGWAGYGGSNNGGTADGGGAVGGDVNNYGGGSLAYHGGGAVGITGTGRTGNTFYDPTTWTGDGGDCDVIGDLWSSSLGNIAGGNGGIGVFRYQINSAGSAPGDSRIHAQGPLAGGGQVHSKDQQYRYYVRAGDAIIGGGGGPASSGDYPYANPPYHNYCISGKGGEGLIVIQYIP